MYAVGQEDLPQVPDFIRSQAAKRTRGGLLMGKEEKSTEWCVRGGNMVRRATVRAGRPQDVWILCGREAWAR